MAKFSARVCLLLAGIILLVLAPVLLLADIAAQGVKAAIEDVIYTAHDFAEAMRDPFGELP
jgi:hypothetical protein